MIASWLQWPMTFYTYCPALWDTYRMFLNEGQKEWQSSNLRRSSSKRIDEYTFYERPWVVHSTTGVRYTDDSTEYRRCTELVLLKVHSSYVHTDLGSSYYVVHDSSYLPYQVRVSMIDSRSLFPSFYSWAFIIRRTEY